MEISAVLAAGLAALTEAFGNDEIDLEAELRALIAGVRHAVPSYVGMTMTIAVDGHHVSFSEHAKTPTAGPPRTSLAIPLRPRPGATAGSGLVLFAATPGAFVDLAADLSYVLGLGPALVLDAHLGRHAKGVSDDATTLDQYFRVNQAIGVLIERGHTPESARVELRRLASRDHGNLDAAAGDLLRAAAEPTDTN